MADTFKGIITADGKKRQLPYGSVLETPVSDETLSIQGAFADAKAVGDKFKEVKENLGDVDARLSESIIEISDVVDDLYLNKDFESTTTGYKWFKFETVSGGTYKYKNNTSVACIIQTYDAENGNRVETVSASLAPQNEVVFTATQNAPYLRILFQAKGSVSVEKTNSVINGITGRLSEVEENKMPDKLPSLGNTKASNYIDDMAKGLYVYKSSRNLLAETYENDKFLDNFGNLTTDANYATYGYFSILGGNKIYFSRKATATTRTKDACKFAFYDEDKVFISTSAWTSAVVNVPTTAKYARASIAKAYTAYSPMVEYGDANPVPNEYEAYFAPYYKLLPQKFKEKSICVIGDSLAANGNGGLNNWIQKVGDYLGFKNVYNRGVGSSTVEPIKTLYAYVDENGDAYNRGAYSSHQTFSGYTEIDACLSGNDRVNTIPTDTDVLLVLAGANDVGQSGSSIALIKESYGTFLDKVNARIPNAKVLLCTMPFHKAFDLGESASVYQNVRNAIKEVGADYGYEVIDLKSVMGVNKNNYATYMNADYVHYNTTKGTLITAMAVVPFIEKLVFVEN